MRGHESIDVNKLIKLNIITHNIRGLNDPENIAKERDFLNSLTPRENIVMV